MRGTSERLRFDSSQAALPGAQAHLGADRQRLHEHELEHRLMRLLQHLLKWQYQPVRRGRSWRSTIVEQRQRIAKRLRESPSLRPALPAMLEEEYRLARLKAGDETRLPEAILPPTCPWTVEQLLDDAFWPEAPEAAPEGQPS